MGTESVQRSQRRLESRKYVDRRPHYSFIAFLSVPHPLPHPSQSCTCSAFAQTGMDFCPHCLQRTSCFAPFRLSLHRRYRGYQWCEKSMTANVTAQNPRTTGLCTHTAEWASPGGTGMCENNIFPVSIGSKFPQISFGRDPVVLVLLTLFPTPSRDYQLMRTKPKWIYYSSFLRLSLSTL